MAAASPSQSILVYPTRCGRDFVCMLLAVPRLDSKTLANVSSASGGMFDPPDPAREPLSTIRPITPLKNTLVSLPSYGRPLDESVVTSTLTGPTRRATFLPGLGPPLLLPLFWTLLQSWGPHADVSRSYHSFASDLLTCSLRTAILLHPSRDAHPHLLWRCP